MFNDKRTVMGSGKGWPPDDSEYAPTQLGDGARTGDHPTPRTIPAGDGEATWSPPSPAPGASLFRPTTEPSGGPSSQASSDRTMLISAEPEPQVPLAWLAIAEGPGGRRGTVFTLKLETMVGRTSGDFLLSGDPTVSSQHLRIRLEPREGDEEGEQVFVLYDQASANGTYVGTRETYTEEESRVYRHELKDDDYLLVGETTLVFKQVD